jgi:multidrug resistance efflux pump
MNLNTQNLVSFRLRPFTGVALLAFCLGVASCSNEKSGLSSRTNETAANLIVLNANAGGMVRRVFVAEGVTVREGAPIIEIESEGAGVDAAVNESDAANEARRRAAQSRTSVRADEREIELALIEVQRVESLVAQNAAPQAQLDAARALYQAAQERLQQTPRGGQHGLPQHYPQTANAASAANANSAARAIQVVRATQAGSVRVISVRAGQRVAAGQPVATMTPLPR